MIMTQTKLQNLVRKHEVKRALGKPRRRWEDNIKINLRETGCEGVDLIQLALDRVHQQQ
jgi:hypothetical protein